jgi:hypothetical protein
LAYTELEKDEVPIKLNYQVRIAGKSFMVDVTFSLEPIVRAKGRRSNSRFFNNSAAQPSFAMLLKNEAICYPTDKMVSEDTPIDCEPLFARIRPVVYDFTAVSNP